MGRSFPSVDDTTQLFAPDVMGALDEYNDGRYSPPATGRFSLKDFGAKGNGTTDDSAAIQAAFNAAAAADGTVVGGGTYRINSTVTLAANADLGNTTFNYYGTGVALNLGSGSPVLQRRVITTPRVILATKLLSNGWTAGTVGIRLNSAYASLVTVPHVKNFAIGLQLYGQQNNGVSYCTVTIGGLDNNKINLDLNGDDTGWANQNLFVGGRFSHDSAEGTQVAGTKHILLTDIPLSRPNNNTFLNPSIESTNTVEFAIDIQSGTNNLFVNPRMEDTTGIARIRYGAKCQLTKIEGGFGVAATTAITKIAGNARNMISTNDFVERQGGSTPMLRYENANGSGVSTLALYAAGTLSAPYVANSDWLLSLAATSAKWKNKADTQERIRVEAQGRIYLGPGLTTAPVAYLSGTAADIVVNAGDLIPEADNTRSLGKAALQWLNIFARKLTIGTAQHLNGAGSPEGVATAPVGSLYTRSDGGTGTTLYVKESGAGATGWVAK